ncbi:MAG: L-lactate MFS transporter [Promethearchaeota archaeon]
MTKNYIKITARNRWLVVFAAVFMELALGALYAWSTFAKILWDPPYSWTSPQTQWVFSAGTLALAIAVIFAGKLNEKFGPQKLILISAIVTGSGYILGGILPLQWVWTSITVGLIGGAGIGIAYAIPISVCSKWFPDKKGIVTGLGMAGFGLGSLIWQYLLTGVFNNTVGISWTFIIYGICFTAMIGAAYFFIYNPPEDYLVEGYDPSVIKNKSDTTDEVNFETKQILKTPQFYFLFYALMVGSAVGLMIIGMSKIYSQNTLSGLGYTNAASIASIAVAVILPIFNGLGRILWGWFSDKIGWKLSIIIMDSVQAITIFLFFLLVQTPLTLYIAVAIIAFNYGGNFTVFPMATGGVFGRKYLSSNYGWVFFSFGIGALIGPPLAGYFDESSNIIYAFIISGVMLVIGVAMTFFIKQPKKTE